MPEAPFGALRFTRHCQYGLRQFFRPLLLRLFVAFLCIQVGIVNFLALLARVHEKSTTKAGYKRAFAVKVSGLTVHR